MSVLDYTTGWYETEDQSEPESRDELKEFNRAISDEIKAIGYWKCANCSRQHPPSHDTCWWCNPTYKEMK